VVNRGQGIASAPADASPIPPAVDPASYAALVTANNRFALDLFQQFNPSADENAFFSPYSISTALAMTWAGAQGDTAAQMAKVLHFAEMPGNTVWPSFTALQSAVARAQTLSGAQLALANSLWPEQNPESPLRPDYLNLVQSSFASAITPVDFINHAPDAMQQINAWVEDKTNGKIKNLIHDEDVDALTRLVLVNAIYFKGQWATAFQPFRDANSEFHAADGSAIPAVLMNLTLNTRYADITDGPVPCQVVALAYSSASRQAGAPLPLGISFVAILPRAEGDLGALEKALTPDLLTNWLATLSNTMVQVILPKFKLEDRYQLADNLRALGMPDAFTAGKADFSGMDGTRNLFIAKVIHQTFLDVDENGTEAAAATAVVLMFGAAGGGRGGAGALPVFRADHPFLFMIRDDTTGSILFLGQLTHPAALQETSPARPPLGLLGTRATGARGTSPARGPIFRGGSATATGSATAPATSTASAAAQ
jgi:serpin B